MNVQITFGNLAIEARFSFDVIQLLAVALHGALMAKGQQGVFAGVDAAGNRVADNDTISDDFKELDRGRWFSLVNEDGAMEHWRLRGWLMVVAADYPQAQAMGPYMEGCQAKCLCRGCNYEREQASVHSFFEPNAKWKLREQLRLRLLIAGWRRKRDGAAMQREGINKLIYALCPEYFPFINEVRCRDGLST